MTAPFALYPPKRTAPDTSVLALGMLRLDVYVRGWSLLSRFQSMRCARLRPVSVDDPAVIKFDYTLLRGKFAVMFLGFPT